MKKAELPELIILNEITHSEDVPEFKEFGVGFLRLHENYIENTVKYHLNNYTKHKYSHMISKILMMVQHDRGKANTYWKKRELEEFIFTMYFETFILCKVRVDTTFWHNANPKACADEVIQYLLQDIYNKLNVNPEMLKEQFMLN